jgi:sulfatase maturation enzyme AslB (radical SAM superfamily)
MASQIINLSLNPTYLCNFRCEFCYLTPEQLADKNTLEIVKYRLMLKEIKDAGYQVGTIDLYGGEVALLDEYYLNQVYRWAKDIHEVKRINVITNLSKINPFFLKPEVDLCVSFDFEARERHEQVLANIAKVPKPIGILMLASPNLLKLDVNRMISILNAFQNVVSVELKPYSANQANTLPVTDKDFEEFVKKWITSSVNKRFRFINEEKIIESLNGTYNAFSDNHVYITPNGKFGVLEFDQKDNEFFMELDSFGEYLLWVRHEQRRVNANEICSACPYLGHCLTEHYRDVKSIENSCSGFRHLLDWADQNLA